MASPNLRHPRHHRPWPTRSHRQLLHGDTLQPRVLGFSQKANEVKDEATEPCKIEGVSMVLDSADSERVSGNHYWAEYKGAGGVNEPQRKEGQERRHSQAQHQFGSC